MNRHAAIVFNKEFYNDFKQTNPSLILGLIIITLGLYIINWIYLTNKSLEKIDSNAPKSARGAIVMMVLPFFWFFLIMVLKTLFFSVENLILGIVEIVGWGLILFILVKYLFDFCISFANVTKSNAIFWFLLLFIGILGLISIPFQFLYTIPLIFFLIIAIPAMQADLNSFFYRYTIKKEKRAFYH